MTLPELKHGLEAFFRGLGDLNPCLGYSKKNMPAPELVLEVPKNHFGSFSTGFFPKGVGRLPGERELLSASWITADFF